MNKQTLYALAVFVLLIIAAGIIETRPLISALCIAAMPVCIYRGELWEVHDEE